MASRFSSTFVDMHPVNYAMPSFRIERILPIPYVGTDRHNVVQIADMKKNYFEMDMFQDPKGMFAGGKIHWTAYQGRGGASGMTPLDKTIQMATSGFLECEEACQKGADSHTMDPLMNNASPTFKGMLVEHERGTFHYMCTRNSNFGKRDQKGTLIVY